MQEFADAKAIRCVVPSNVASDKIPVPVSRSRKRFTILVSIFADGTYGPPLVIVPRNTIGKELLSLGYTPDKVMFAHQSNEFIDSAIFAQWFTNYLVP